LFLFLYYYSRLFVINTLGILFWIDVGEKDEEPKDLTTFISDEELSDKDDEKVEEPNDLMTLSPDEELSDKEENVVLPVVLKDDEKIEELIIGGMLSKLGLV
jgi:hypothetical protein